MNEITKAQAVSLPTKVVAASSSSDSTRLNKSGNDLPTAAQAATPQPEKHQSQEDVQASVQAAVAQMNEYIQSSQRDLHFSYDPSSGETVVRVLDRNTQEVIRQIPDEIFLRLAQNFNPEEPVQLFSAQA